MIFQLCLVSICIGFITSTHHSNPIVSAPKIGSKNAPLNWSTVDAKMKSTIDSFFINNLDDLYKFTKQLNVSSRCRSSIFQLFLALRNTESWAMHMADSSGKLPSGLLDGTVMDFGSFEECLRIRANDTNGEELFRGRYCMVGFKSPLVSPLYQKAPDGRSYVEAYGHPPAWMADVIDRAGGYLKRIAFWFGTCVPSSCSEKDVRSIAQVFSNPLGFKVMSAGCEIDEPYKWPPYAFAAVCFLSTILGLCILGTVIDGIFRCLYNEKQHYCETENLTLQILKAFSLLSNTEMFFSSGSGSNTLGCFHGIRFFSATWIILGHTYFFTDSWKYLKYRHLRGVEEQFDHFLPLAVIENFTIPVGSFFFMSGFLLVYATWKKLEKEGGRLNLAMFFLHKYWRMTPALGLMMALFLALPIVNNGPIWNSTLDPPIKACVKNWWTNLLYINNFWDQDQYCLIHTWYLAALMQFHLVGVVILILFFRWPFVGSLLGIAVAFGSCIVTALVTVWNDFPMPAPGYVKDMDIVDSYNSQIYIKPFNHVTTYLIGMAFAHIVLKYKDKKISRMYQVLGWILSIAGALSSVYGLYGPAEHVAIRALYIACHRIGWTLAIGWLTYACITGIGGIVNRILSWKAFVPLGQLSYLVYLIHPLVILYRNASLRERVYYGHTELVYEYLSYTTISFIIAFLGYVTVEMPFTNLEGVLFNRSSIKSSKEVVQVMCVQTKDQEP